eukprot:TRINITY_DN55389_c0_g2_i1.p1 TRINITY_DN55389_c0_g2~~TRINITY_DN55389_c0_g2_i1.p1  ORF type:complete len:101 (-),score=12.04 TRINITY_DN55389_c0_g2_i1:94-396(-)
MESLDSPITKKSERSLVSRDEMSMDIDNEKLTLTDQQDSDILNQRHDHSSLSHKTIDRIDSEISERGGEKMLDRAESDVSLKLIKEDTSPVENNGETDKA